MGDLGLESLSIGTSFTIAVQFRSLVCPNRLYCQTGREQEDQEGGVEEDDDR